MTDPQPSPTRAGPRAAAITPIGAAGIAVIRVVGPDALALVHRAFEPLSSTTDTKAVEPGRVVYGRIVDNGRVIDDAVVTVRPLTVERDGLAGELVEINPHGGIRVVQRILMLLVRLGAALASPDEIGLLGWPADNAIEREVWASLVRAQTHRAAVWLAHQQTALPDLLRECIRRLESHRQVEQVAAELQGLLDRYKAARRLVDGAGIAIAGPPNAGKSTLANRLFGRQRSIIAEQPGTTRDWVAEPAAVDGVPIVLVDTAGLRLTDDPIERASVERALDRVRLADVVLLVLDRSQPMDASARYAIQAVAKTTPLAHTLLVLNKCDLPDRLGQESVLDRAWAARVSISAATGDGIDQLGHLIVKRFGLADWSERVPGIWTSRQEIAVRDALAQLPDRVERAAEVLGNVLEIL